MMEPHQNDTYLFCVCKRSNMPKCSTKFHQSSLPVTQGWFLLKPPPDADRNCYEGALERVDGRIRNQR